MPPLQFSISHRDTTSHARRGTVHTLHGSFDTPAFMPVGTRASVKGLLPQSVKDTGAQIILNNTYHLLLRPGPQLVQRMGGVHKFMNWPGPILTDSGGYQAYSLSAMNTVDDDGVTFKSTIDGSMVRMTPEIATQVQNQLGPDIVMAFDDCPPSIAASSDERDEAQTHRLHSASRGLDAHARLLIANERTVRWLERCKAAHARPSEQSLFGIVQGGADLAQRTWSAERICNIELPGYAIGGVAVGETFADIARVVSHTAPLLPDQKPRYLMGVGYERDILAAVRAGVDMFDCVLPTRNGRNANAFTPTGQLRLRNAKHAEDQSPIEPGCDCVACNPSAHGMTTPEGLPFSRGYLRHLFMVGEMLGPILVSLHNLRYFQRFMQEVRQAIALGDWNALLLRYPIAAEGFMAVSAPAEPRT
jgi:queuine tRNA-ribosyltransferase